MSAVVARRVRHPLHARMLEVRRVEDVTPSRRRIVLAGDLAGFRSESPDDHIKLIFPDAPGALPRLPVVEEERVRYPAGVTRPVMRDYTPYAFDVEAGELTVEFVLHGDGPASAWAAAARPGDPIGQAGPRGSLVVEGVRHWVLLGDESSLPAIARRLAELEPGATAAAFVEVGSDRERVALPVRDGVTVTWLTRDGSGFGGPLLVGALAALPVLGDGTFVWGGAEAGVARRLREHLRDERAHPPERMKVTGYWRVGVADHHDG